MLLSRMNSLTMHDERNTRGPVPRHFRAALQNVDFPRGGRHLDHGFDGEEREYERVERRRTPLAVAPLAAPENELVEEYV